MKKRVFHSMQIITMEAAEYDSKTKYFLPHRLQVLPHFN